MFFKKKKKAGICIEFERSNKDSEDHINFMVSWNKEDTNQIAIFVKLLVMLSHGELQQHIENAIAHYGQIHNDRETANIILNSIYNINESIGKKSAEIKYLNSIISENKRNPAIGPDEVLHIFKNSIS
jgi:hypothetical protein